MLPLLASLALTSAPTSAAAAAPHGPAMPHLLFVDRQEIAEIDPRLELVMQPPVKNDRVLSPTEPWESWAVFAYNHVVAGVPGKRPHRMYYDCIEGSGTPPGDTDSEAPLGEASGALSHRRICLAESEDGKTWTKPSLGIFKYGPHNSTDNNILLEDSGNSVFEEPDGSWKMVCSGAAYSSPDGLHWTPLPFKKTAEDDTKPTAYWDPALKKYVVSVRRDCGSTLVGEEACHWVNGSRVHALATRYVGRCVTSSISDWQEEVKAPGGGCPVVFGPDEVDPQPVDVYTNAWTPYPSIDAPVLHLFFPSFYHHFSSTAPFGFGNDGLLDIRLVVSRDNEKVGYSEAKNGRSPWVPLGVNKCGGAAHAPGNVDGWCSPATGVESGSTDFDTSAMYMASGYVPADNGDEIYFYSSGQPFTHGGDGAKHSWGNNSGIRRLTARRDGFVAIEAPYIFAKDLSSQPSFTTVKLKVPETCPPPVNTSRPIPPGKKPSPTGCSYEYPGGKCPASKPTVPCKNDTACKLAVCGPSRDCSCHGVAATCIASKGVCGTPAGAELCYTGKPAAGGDGNETVTSGGVQLFVNMETSVAGFVAIAVVDTASESESESGSAGYTLTDADKLKGSATNAVASWGGGAVATVSQFAGKEIALKVAMADAKLFSLRLGCA